MPLTPAAGIRPKRPDYHLWCEKDDFSHVLVCHKCGLTIDTTKSGGYFPVYGCPGSLHEQAQVNYIRPHGNKSGGYAKD